MNKSSAFSLLFIIYCSLTVHTALKVKYSQNSSNSSNELTQKAKQAYLYNELNNPLSNEYSEPIINIGIGDDKIVANHYNKLLQSLNGNIHSAESYEQIHHINIKAQKPQGNVYFNILIRSLSE